MLPTKEGKRFLLAMLLIGLAALNTGNNLIYLVFSMMTSILVVSYVVLATNLSGLSLKVFVKRPVFANQSATIDVTVKNMKQGFSSYSLNIILPDGMSGRGFVPKVNKSSSANCEAHVLFKSRGVYKYGDFYIESGYPFIFFRKKISIPVEGEVTVYPEIRDVEGIASVSGEAQGMSSIRTGRSDELLSIREHRHGDDIGVIDWKASAKTNKLMVKEFGIEEPRSVSIVLDDVEPFFDDAFERAVSYAASIAMELLDNGYYVGFLSSSKKLPRGSGNEQLLKILDVLAVIKERSAEESLGPEEILSPSILILKSDMSALKGLVPFCEEVIYANTI